LLSCEGGGSAQMNAEPWRPLEGRLSDARPPARPRIHQAGGRYPLENATFGGVQKLCPR
jgi:hypothetical protein